VELVGSTHPSIAQQSIAEWNETMPTAYALIHEENGSFGISFPDFPGAVSGGETAEEAIRRGSALLTFHVAGMVEDGETLPALRGLAELKADPRFVEHAEGAVVALVPFEFPTKAVRINISIEESLLGSIDASASAAGQSRSGWLADAARERLRRVA
jgi:predicted RNase H-like HicB family nuclease